MARQWWDEHALPVRRGYQFGRHRSAGDFGVRRLDAAFICGLEFPQNGLRIRWVVGSGAVFWVKQERNWD
ncbi:MAG: hypothetical protein DRH70_08705, partial [Candidatus Coatesbacteria bacterium]